MSNSELKQTVNTLIGLHNGNSLNTPLSSNVLSSIPGVMQGIERGLNLKNSRVNSRNRSYSTVQSDPVSDVNRYFSVSNPEVEKIKSSLPEKNVFGLPSVSDPTYRSRVNIPTVEQQTTKLEEEQKLKKQIEERKEAEVMKVRIGMLISRLSKDAPSIELPQIRPDATLEELQSIYKTCQDKILLDSWVSKYKNLILVILLIVQWLGGRMGFPMKGFLYHQYKNLTEYHMLLVELGEKKLSSGEITKSSGIVDSWPVEYRLVNAIMINFGMYLFINMISEKMNISPKEVENFVKELSNNSTNLMEQQDTARQAEKVNDPLNVPLPNKATGAPTGSGIFNIINGIASAFGQPGMGGDDPMSNSGFNIGNIAKMFMNNGNTNNNTEGPPPTTPTSGDRPRPTGMPRRFRDTHKPPTEPVN
jgi:hypothetical protein